MIFFLKFCILTELTMVAANVKTGAVESESILVAIQPNTCLISVILANNETGVIQPVSEIGEKLEQINKDRLKTGLNRILFHTDAAQAIGKIPVDVGKLKVDLLTIVGHKVK